MNALYRHADYRPAIKDLMLERKKTNPRSTFHALANAVRVQDSYLSKVMNGHAHFSADQLYLATRFLSLTNDDEDYLRLLHDFQTSAVESRRKQLKGKIRERQETHLDTQKHLRAETLSVAQGPSTDAYYLDPLHQIVHVALSVPRYQKSIDRLAKELMIPAARAHSYVSAIAEMGLAEHVDGVWRSTGRHLHLQRDSPIYGPWEAQLRMLGHARKHLQPKEQAYSFSVVFSGNEDARRELVRRLLDLIRDAETLVGEAPEEEVYQLDLDVFSWTKTRED